MQELTALISANGLTSNIAITRKIGGHFTSGGVVCGERCGPSAPKGVIPAQLEEYEVCRAEMPLS